jgi:hypothetical protein
MCKCTANRLDIWSHEGKILPNGTQVISLVDTSSHPVLWIHSSVVGYTTQPRAFYEVVDEDPGPEVKKRYKLPPSHVIPIPSLEEYPLNIRRQFNKDEQVLAWFPETTSFYPAYVVAGPKKRHDELYELQFSDDEDGIYHADPLIDDHRFNG